MKPAKGLLDWIKTGIGEVVSAIDAERAAKIDHYVTSVEIEVRRLKQAFVFAPVVQQLGISRTDLPVVQERVYQRFLSRTWSDASLTAREAELLGWLARCVGLDAERKARLDEDAAASIFRQTLATALVDNRISDAESTQLAGIAAAIGHTVPSMMARFFRRDGEAMIRAAFTQYAADGRLQQDEWQRFHDTIVRLGVPQDEVLEAIHLPAKQ